MTKRQDILTKFSALTLSFLLFGVAGPCAVLAESGKPLIFCRPNNMVSAHTYIAEAKGYFAEEGLEVKFEQATNAKICIDTLLSGRADAMMGAESAFVYLTAHEPSLKILAFAQSNPETAIFFRTDKGIANVSQLKGKKVGYLPGSCSVPYLALALEKNGVAWNEVSLVPLQPPSLTQALIGGAVDAISVWEPWGYNAQKELKEKIAVYRDPQLYSYQAVLISSAPMIANRRGDLLRLMKAFSKAEAFINAQPEESIEILSRSVVLHKEVLKSLWKDFSFRLRLSPADMTLLQTDFRILQKYDTHFRSIPEPKFDKFIDSSFLSEIMPERMLLANPKQ